MLVLKGRYYYGWYITIALALTETVSWGVIYYAFSVFLAPMEADLGWSRAALTGAFSLSLLVMGLMAYPVGAWVDKHGARQIMTAGSIGAALLVVAWSRVETLWVFYLIWVGLGMCAAMVLYDPAFIVVAQWFRVRRGTALAIITFAGGLASTIFLPLSDYLLRAYGWREGIFILGLLLAALTIPPHAFILRHRPQDLNLQPDGAILPPGESAQPLTGMPLETVLRGRTFWLLTVAFGLISLSAGAIRVHFIPFLIDAGINSSTAAFAAGAVGITQVAGRVIFAPLERRVSSMTIAIGLFALQSVAMAVLLIGQTPQLIGAFILFFGAAQGAVTLARPSILTSLYGISHFGRISAVMALFLVVSSTFAPFGASVLFDMRGDYQLVLWIVLALALVATAVATAARRSTGQDTSTQAEHARAVTNDH